MLINPLDFEDKSLKSFFFGINHSMWIIDATFQSILEINDTAAKTYGYSREEIILQSVEKIIPQKEIQKLTQLAADTFFAQKPVKKEISLRHSSHKILYAETVLAGILFEGKEALLLTMTDITEKKLYRNLLEEAIELEISLKSKNKQLKNIAFINFHLARKPLANILGLVNVMDQSLIADKTLAEAIEFLKESGNELDELIKNTDPQQY